MVVVVVRPAVELAVSFGLGGIAAGVDPAVGQGSVGALDLGAGLGPIRPCALVLDAQFVAGVSPQV